ncbi:DUF4194 domain-containing protein [Myxococcus sp. K15C18031901]|uniref:DUF4194 domain-containing protein n=1 Tax=Myxococcus dinghuensis TaxID=2906761 RepID=UPI0020A6E635|nr:DUF4194 domain-containing protein [Myxococcus dinghuensis]MCP3098460.1 DUF4194 domain-containing protein [Myxococcus dinghuensis]
MTNVAPNPSTAQDALSFVLVSLMKGVVYRDESPGTWQSLLQLRARVKDQLGVLGLQLMLDEAEGHAFLRQRAASDGAPELPRLVARRQLGFGVSLLLALLRKKLAEADASAEGGRLVLRRAELRELVQLFQPEGTNEARWRDRVDGDIEKAVSLGFLRPLGEAGDTFEVRRILKAFVDAQWLGDFEQRLARYRAHLTESTGGVE